MPGQVYDSETGQFYNYFRDYDPGTGRYGESDPIGLGGGINTYSYVNGNPVLRSDSLGLQTTAPVPGAPPLTPVFFPGTPENREFRRVTIQAIERLSEMLSATNNNNDIRDKAGLKVSPAAQCLPAPGNCGPGEQRQMQDEVDRACKRPRACKPGMNAVELVLMRESNRECATARDRINKTCFAGGDLGHRDAAIDAWNAVANCEGMMQ
jgi:type VI secretion system secreted protein VgrG